MALGKNPERPGFKLSSKKIDKENERILRMKNKPTRRKITDQDLPKFKKGKNWREWNSSERVKEAIKRNMNKK